MYVPTEQSWPSVDIRRQKSFATHRILQQWSIHTVESGQINRTQNPKPPHFAAQYIFLLLKCRDYTLESDENPKPYEWDLIFSTNVFSYSS
jgi:hypothetical protein